MAIANEGGGHLILGVSNNPPQQVVGSDAFKNPVKTEPQLFNKLKFRVDVEGVNHPDGRVVVVGPGLGVVVDDQVLERLATDVIKIEA